jgi:ribosomal protein S8
MKKIILNFLIQLKNISKLGDTSFEIKNSLKLKPLLILLYNEGYIQTFSFIKNNKVVIYTRNCNINPLNLLKLWGVSSKKKYVTYNEISKFSNKNNLLVLSTHKGYKSLYDCKKNKLGGRLYLST